MRMMTKGMLRVALILGLVAVPVGTVEAADDYGPTAAFANEVHVVNNYVGDVRVYAEDSFGRMHVLGRVRPGQLQTFEVPSEVTEREFRIKIFPAGRITGRTTLLGENFGVKSNPLDATTINMLTVWVEPDLTQSRIEVDRG